MKTSLIKKASLSIIFASIMGFGHANASEFDLRISNDTVHGGIAIMPDESDAIFGLGYLYKDESSINILNLDLHAKGQTALFNLPTTIGVGVQGNIFKEHEFEGSAIGLGGSIRMNLPDLPGLSIESEAHYAPSVLSFADADDFTRIRLQGNYRIIESADVSAGYRLIQAGQESDSNRTFESGAYVGLKLKF